MTESKTIILKKECQCCGKEFVRSNNLSYKQWDSRIYCGKLCSLKSIDKDPTIELLDRFYSKVLKPKSKDLCWVWIGSIDKKGYGRININGLPKSAHRVSWEIHKGIIPSAMIVRHICDNPSCVNPQHLMIGTHQDNSNDCKERGRGGDKGSTKGVDHYCASFTEKEIKLIRISVKSGVSLKQISDIYNVNKTTIDRIFKRKTWKNVE